MELLKKVPIPIWIGLGLVLIVILLVSRNSSGGQQQTVAGGNVNAAAGPVTTATVGTQGAQVGAGTDQQLGNLSVITQGGFAQIAQQEQGNQLLLSELASGMNGVGTPMQQLGTTVQASQTNSAQFNAANGSNGQNAGSNPSAVTTH